MAELRTVDHLVDGYARVGEHTANVDTIHTDTVTAVAADRAARTPEATPETEES